MFWIYALLALVAVYALRLWSESSKRVMGLRIENTRLAANLDYERRMHLLFVDLADGWQKRYAEESARLAALLSPSMLVHSDGRVEFRQEPGRAEEVETPTIAQADRMAVEAERVARERERTALAQRKRVDAEESADEARDFTGMEPIEVTGDASVPPVRRTSGDDGDDASG